MAKVALLLGTSRKDNWSTKVADYVLNKLQNAGFEATLVKPEDHLDKPQTGRVGQEIEANEWSKTMSEAKALVIVTPEYNHGYPGELKLMLDQLWDEYKGKPVLVCGVSDGGLGGARAVENILPVLIDLSLVPFRTGVYFSRVNELFDDNGNVANESIEKGLDAYLQKIKEVIS